MSTFEILALLGLAAIAWLLFSTVIAIDGVAKELKEIWRRMGRPD